MPRLLPLLLLVALGCAGEPPAQNEPPPAATEEPADEAPARAKPLHLARVADREAKSFPHEPHVDITCARCHTNVPGHGGHARMDCRECHAAPAAPAGKADCSGCHHAPTAAYGCKHCHEQKPTPGKVEVAVRVASNRLGAARALPFAHARHEQFQCDRCHDSKAATVAACTSCHERHHRADAECRTCHERVPTAVHPAAKVHLGCAGSGCHQDATVTSLPLTRPVCVVCHAAQADHEPNQDCASCHRLRRGAS